MKIMLAGDTHGDFLHVKHKIDMAKKVGNIQRIVVLGDFGLWWGFEGIKYLDEINEYARDNNVQIFAIPGNHENMEYWNALVEHAPATAHGWAYIRTHLLLSPRIHKFRWNNKQFVVAGGAVSIDKASRLEYERKKGKQIWSPHEQLTDNEVETVESWAHGSAMSGGVDSVDYLLTHDCSNATPWEGRLKPDMDSQIHRQRIDRVLKALKPKFHFHGHMHDKYDWYNRVGGGEWTQTYGLECNNDLWSWGILDLDTDEWVWSKDIYDLWSDPAQGTII